MKLDELIAHHRAKVNPPEEFHLRLREYREHYPLIKEAVQQGIPLRSAVTILKDEEGAFRGRNIAAVWQAYRRALKHDQIHLSTDEK
jgi:hypothetical protein